MDIRLVVLSTAVWFAVSSGSGSAELQPKDPDQAPIATVDRFSDAAGTLLKRSADNHLPGPNEPIDFDTPPFNVWGLSPAGEPALYYHLDVKSTTPVPVYILYREGEDMPVQEDSILSTRCQVSRAITISGRFGRCGCRKITSRTRLPTRRCCSKQATKWKRQISCLTWR